MNSVLAYCGLNKLCTENQQTLSIVHNLGKIGFFTGTISAIASKIFKITPIPALTITFASAVTWLYCSIVNKKQAKKDYAIPEEFKELIQKVQNLNFFKNFDMSAVYSGCRSAREIVIGSNAGINEIFIKQPTGKRMFLRQPYAKQEQLSFMVSHRLNLDVVPVTMACEGYKNILDRISMAVRSHLFNGIDDNYKGVVIQEGVEFASNQFHMKNFVNLRLSNEDAEKEVLEQGKKAISEFALNIDNICRAIIFNVIIGRTDAGRRNSVIDKFNKIKEIDNESIGATKTDSWLLDIFSDCILNRELVDNLLAFEDSLFENIFKDLECFQPTFFWNENTYKFDVVDSTKENIINNFNKLKEFLLSNKGNDIRVKDLKKNFYVQGIFN